MAWPIDDLDLSDLSADSGNLARARNQIYGWQTKTKETIAANPLVNDDSIYYLRISHDGTKNGVTIDATSPNASSFTVNSDVLGTLNSEFAIRHNLDILPFKIGYFFQVLSQSDSTLGIYVTTTAILESRAVDVMDAIILNASDGSLDVPYVGTCDIGITMLRIP